MKPKISPIPIKNQIAHLLDQRVSEGNIHIWENWERLWKIYQPMCDAEKQKACLMYLTIGPDDELAAEIERKIRLLITRHSYDDDYWPHLRRVLHNAEWEGLRDYDG